MAGRIGTQVYKGEVVSSLSKNHLQRRWFPFGSELSELKIPVNLFSCLLGKKIRGKVLTIYCLF